MSQQQIDHSPDLKRLRDEGFDIDAHQSGYLIVKDIPYLNSQKEVGRGTLVSSLTLAGDVAAYGGDHVVHFQGEYPCNLDGTEIEQIRHGNGPQRIHDTLETQYSFSNKPPEGYADYYAKMTNYIAILSHPAKAIDPALTAQTYPAIEDTEPDSVFVYTDTASSRADIVPISNKLRGLKVGIVGLGGTGSYILDMVAKTPVTEIHLFDADVFLQHNAFRAPGAASIGELRRSMKKTRYLRGKYSRMHKGIVSHPYAVTSANSEELNGLDFVFLSMDGGDAKKGIVEKLTEFSVPFIDTGVGVQTVEEALLGQVRLTTSTEGRREHAKRHISFEDNGVNEYDKNIQVADLNALNAALAVIRWKKHLGFYKDHEGEYNSIYDIDGNVVHNSNENEIEIN